MKFTKALLLLAMVVGLGSMIAMPAYAAKSKRTFGQIYTQCGLGAMIAPHTPVVAAITNVTWDLGTTAIISNASSPGTCKGDATKTADLIYHAYPSVEKDVAIGKGKDLNALVALASCPVSARPLFIHSMRHGLSGMVKKADYSTMPRKQKAADLYQVFNHSVSAAGCQMVD